MRRATRLKKTIQARRVRRDYLFKLMMGGNPGAGLRWVIERHGQGRSDQ